MTTKEILQYYSETTNRSTREDLMYASNLIGNVKVAVDCGCGAGSDIAYLSENGFRVHAFDINEESVRLCSERFSKVKNVFLSHESFSSFEYPKSTLIVADASLFFCPPEEFYGVWRSISESLNPEGVFCGSFLGQNDTMAGPNYDRKAFWEHVLVFTEAAVRALFSEFEILKFVEHNVSGEIQGIPQQWHIYSVVAKKYNK
ncbi:class I SAM-dependent methyltransferase [Shewanella marina]|uniref:class I SAM-dependent methyltransferase n=1 Tax=Shewanella marina TaxID=487319 RepID=UPI00046FADBC|nr:class I SAM-dependent methyltransferase [Shewanella marina]